MPKIVFDRRSIILTAAGAVILIVGIQQIVHLAANRSLLRPFDFVQYWSAGRQLLDGRNPYDPDELIVLQRSMDGNVRKTVMMWNPPWTLPLTLPFAAMPWRLAQFIWIGLQLSTVIVSADLLWRIYDGGKRYRWISWLIALTFAPTLFLLMIGQISGLLLLGVTGFLHFQRRNCPTLAGCCAALTAIKPHFLPLFGLTLLLEATRRRSTRRAILSGAAAIVLFSLAPLFWNSRVWNQYFAAMQRPPSENLETMRQYEFPTLGYQLRRWIPDEPFAAQFIPVGLAGLATIVYWFRRRHSWQWGRELPVLVLASVLTTAYGGWAFDLVVLLLPIMPVAVWLVETGKQLLGALTATIFLVLNGLVLMTISHVGSQSNPWIAPVVAAAFIVFKLIQGRQQHQSVGAPLVHRSAMPDGTSGSSAAL